MSVVGDDIVLRWDPSPSPDADHYLIFRSTDPTAMDFDSPIASTTQTSYTDTGLGADISHNYYYVVRAVDTRPSQTRS